MWQLAANIVLVVLVARTVIGWVTSKGEDRKHENWKMLAGLMWGTCLVTSIVFIEFLPPLLNVGTAIRDALYLINAARQ